MLKIGYLCIVVQVHLRPLEKIYAFVQNIFVDTMFMVVKDKTNVHYIFHMGGLQYSNLYTCNSRKEKE